VDAVQVIHNIFDQAPEDSLFPLSEKLDIGMIAHVPLDEDDLTVKQTLGTRFPDTDWRAGYFVPENLPQTVARAEALKELLPDGMSLPEMALRFVLSNQNVGTSIGVDTLDHPQEHVAASDGVGLPADLINQLRAHRWDRKVAPWSD
jgi:aryl-alcohol dehydrogenase-like predicted oxidoreductase